MNAKDKRKFRTIKKLEAIGKPARFMGSRSTHIEGVYANDWNLYATNNYILARVVYPDKLLDDGFKRVVNYEDPNNLVFVDDLRSYRLREHNSFEYVFNNLDETGDTIYTDFNGRLMKEALELFVINDIPVRFEFNKGCTIMTGHNDEVAIKVMVAGIYR